MKQLGNGFDQDYRNTLNNNFNEADSRLSALEKVLKDLGFIEQ